MANSAAVKTVGDPCAAYDHLLPVWAKCRAVCGGERHVKELDSLIDTNGFTNLLIPFSPVMEQSQYNFYKAEAELPGITSQFSKMLVSGLLRKMPNITYADKVPQAARDWIVNEIGHDGSSMLSFLDALLTEEVQTYRGWIILDCPNTSGIELDKTESEAYRPYPCLHPAETIINWRTTPSPTGGIVLDRLVVKGFVEQFGEPGSAFEFHPELYEVVYVHELVGGMYQIRKFKRKAGIGAATGSFAPDGDPVMPTIDSERLDYIPAWPSNGSLEPLEPVLSAIIDKEVALYNKISRRNHLLYGAATYTPWIASDMLDEEFQEIAGRGLGSWLHLRQGDTCGALQTPTAALADMEKAIASAIEEMAKLGIRMLTPETSQSGIALEIRNAGQTATLSALNNRVSQVMRQVILTLLNWRYGLDLTPADVQFTLSTDFEPTPVGPEWLKLVTEWYQAGLVPRSVWLTLLRQNDLLPADYDDKMAEKEINDDDLIASNREAEARMAEMASKEMK